MKKVELQARIERLEELVVGLARHHNGTQQIVDQVDGELDSEGRRPCSRMDYTLDERIRDIIESREVVA